MSKGFEGVDVGKAYGDWGPDREVRRRVHDCYVAHCGKQAEYALFMAENAITRFEVTMCYDHLLAAGYTPTHPRVRRA